MKKDWIFIGIFIFCSLVIVVDYSKTRMFWDAPNWFLLYVVLMSGSVAYVGIFAVYLILSTGYNRLKSIFYDTWEYVIHKTLDGDRNFFKELGSAYVLSFILNFLVLYFISITPVSEIITKIPGLDISSLKNLDFKLFDINKLSGLGIDVILFPFTTFGIVILFALKCVRRREHNQTEGHYPWDRAILGFIYAVLVILCVNAITTYVKIGYNKEQFVQSDFYYNFVVALFFTILDIFAVIVVTVADRLLIQKRISNKSHL